MDFRAIYGSVREQNYQNEYTYWYAFLNRLYVQIAKIGKIKWLRIRVIFYNKIHFEKARLLKMM